MTFDVDIDLCLNWYHNLPCLSNAVGLMTTFAVALGGLTSRDLGILLRFREVRHYSYSELAYVFCYNSTGSSFALNVKSPFIKTLILIH